MRTAVLTNQQSLLDFAVQHCGSAEAAMDVALMNGLDLTADFEPGTELLLPEVADRRTAQEFRQGKLHPATGMTTSALAALTNGGEGVEFWAIEEDFVVS